MPCNRAFVADLTACACALVVAKLALLLVDHDLRFFLGDSASYLHAAFSGWIPPDRSFTYPVLIRVTAVAMQSATSLVVVQTLLGVASALMLFATLRIGFDLRAGWACAIAVLFALEPSQLFYERMAMAESAGQFMLAAQILLILLYVRSGRLWLIPLYVLAGVSVVSFRLSLLPVVLALGALAPLVRGYFQFRSQDRGRPTAAWRTLALHTTVALATLSVAHSGYQHLYGRLAQTTPSYIADQGKMRIGLVAPLVRPHHIARAGLDPALLSEVAFPLEDPRARESHIWDERGLFAAIRRASQTSGLDANRISDEVARYALRDGPLEFVGLGFATLGDYFVPAVRDLRLLSDLGDLPLPEQSAKEVRERLRYDSSGAHRITGPVARYMHASGPWLMACLFLLPPLTVLVLALRWHPHPSQQDLLAVIALASLGLVASHTLFSHIVSFRYLHPLPWLMLAQLALLGDALRPQGPAHRAAPR